jgi:HD-GYP domain-containing protein (c-di-GMP phosphodiesterase class II)
MGLETQRYDLESIKNNFNRYHTLVKSVSDFSISANLRSKLNFIMGSFFNDFDEVDFERIHINACLNDILSHSYKTASIAKDIAKRYFSYWGPKKINPEKVYTAALLHDIGKLGIDEKILSKKGRLTNDEFEECKTHIIRGLTYLDVIEDYFDLEMNELIADAILYHHENYLTADGYLGEDGNNTPLIAQIVKVADVVEVLIAKRCYKEPKSLEETIDILVNGDDRISPHHFHPGFLEAALEGLRKKQNPYYAYSLVLKTSKTIN